MKGSLMAYLDGRPTSRVLVRFPNWIGDAVMALPALEAVRRSLAAGEAMVAARSGVGQVARMAGVATVLLDDHRGVHAGPLGRLRLARELELCRFDAAVLFPNSFGSALVAAAARIPRRGGYACDLRGILLTDPVACPGRRTHQPGHQVHRYLALVRELGFTAKVDPVPRLKVPPTGNADGDYAVFAPGAAFGPAKMWPAERFAELGCRLVRRGLKVLVLGSASEEGICSVVAAGIGPSAQNLAGRTSIREAAGFLAGASLAVSNDSGLMHLAAAVGAPLVALFGPTDPDATGPLSGGTIVLRRKSECAPCRLRRCPRALECFEGLTVDLAEDACLRALAAARGPG